MESKTLERKDLVLLLGRFKEFHTDLKVLEDIEDKLDSEGKVLDEYHIEERGTSQSVSAVKGVHYSGEGDSDYFMGWKEYVESRRPEQIVIKPK